MGQQFQVPGQMPTYQQTQPVGQPQPVQQFNPTSFVPQPGGPSRFQMRHQAMAQAGYHPILNILAQNWGH
jgi:hypothetical protein